MVPRDHFGDSNEMIQGIEKPPRGSEGDLEG